MEESQSNLSHDIVFNNLYSIKTVLEKFHTDTLDIKIHGYTNYYSWHLFAFLPLLREDGLIVLMKIIKLPYNNAQDALIYGLIMYTHQDWISSVEFLIYLRKIFLYWNKHQNIHINNSGTGVISKTIELVREYKKINIDLFTDHVMGAILKENKLLLYIKYKIIKMNEAGYIILYVFLFLLWIIFTVWLSKKIKKATGKNWFLVWFLLFWGPITWLILIIWIAVTYPDHVDDPDIQLQPIDYTTSQQQPIDYPTSQNQTNI